MKKLLILAALAAALLVCPDAHAQLAQRASTLQNAMGRAVPQASITVCAYDASQYALVQQTYSLTTQYVWTYTGPVPCTPALTMYNDPGGAHAITPPLLTSGNGNYTYWIAAGVYTECVAGTQIIANCYAVNVGGGSGGSGPLLQTNGVTNSVQNILNLAGSVTNSAGTTTISGCAVTSLLDTWVLSIHPNATCYGSTDFTWDDTAHNLMVGDTSVMPPTSIAGTDNVVIGAGSEVTDPNAEFDYAIGDGSEVTATSANNTDNFAIGDGSSVGGTGDDSVAMGDGSSVTATTSGSCIPHDNWALGDGDTIDASCGDSYAIGDGNSVSLPNGSDSFQFGVGNSVSSSGSFATGVLFAIGDGASVTTAPTTGGEAQDLFAIGADATIDTTNGCHDYIFGEGTITSSACPGGAAANNYVFGNGSIGGSFDNAFLIGLNGVAASSDMIGIGLSSTPEVEITPGVVAFPNLASGHCLQTGAGGEVTIAAGACGTSSGTLTATGSPAASELACWSGATSVTNCDLSGDVTTSGTAAATVVKVNGGSVPLSAPVLGSNGSGQPVATSLQGNGAKAQLSTGATTPNDCVKYDGNGNTVDAGAPCSTATSGANTALSNLAAVAINTILLPGAVNTVDAGSSALPFRNLYVGQSANHAAQLDGSLLTANRLIKYPDEAGTLMLSTDVLGCAQLGTILTGDVTNSNCATTVQKINGITISATAPATGQVTVMTCIGGNTPVCNNANPAQGEDSQTGATYLIAPSDLGRIVKRSNSGAMTDTIPDPGTANFGQGFYFTLSNSGNGSTDGGGGIVTLSRGASAVFNIDGNPSITKTAIQIGPRQKCVFVAPDTSNWDVWCSGLPTTFGMQAQKDFTSQATAIGSMGSPTTIYTTPASPAGAGYRVTAPLSCDSAVSTATVSFTLNWTDPSGHAQSETSSNAACTTLGSSSYQHIVKDINVQGGTAITFYTTIANAPTYSLHLMLEGAY